MNRLTGMRFTIKDPVMVVAPSSAPSPSPSMTLGIKALDVHDVALHKPKDIQGSGQDIQGVRPSVRRAKVSDLQRV